MDDMEAEMVEMRFMVQRKSYDVFDAVRRARGLNKTALAQSIVTEWALREVHVATVVQRITRGNAVESQSEWDVNGE